MKTIFKTIVKIFAVLLILSGLVWALQGVNILPGSFMSGDFQWTINGAIAILIGTGLFWFASRK
jgi:hypothetical protein